MSGGGALSAKNSRTGECPIVFLDADESARKIDTRLKTWNVPEDKILLLSDVEERPGVDFELEDVISTDVYHSAVCAAYPDYNIDPPVHIAGKRTKYYEGKFKEVHKIGFNKRRVGEHLKQLLVSGKVDDETRNNLRKVTSALVAELEKQVGAAPSTGQKNAKVDPVPAAAIALGPPKEAA